MNLPKSFFIHVASYSEPLGADVWGKESHKEPVLFTCRIDYDVATYRGGDRTDKVVNAVVYTTEELNFKRYGKIVYGDVEHEVHKVVRYDEPYSTKLHHYEIELL